MSLLLESFQRLRSTLGTGLRRPRQGKLRVRVQGKRHLAVWCIGLLGLIELFIFPLDTYGREASAAAWTGGETAIRNCGVSEELHQITSVVVGVHDGDSLTIVAQGKRVSVRLKGIDAPELSQPFGSNARQALASLVLNRPVTVSYSKTDQYGRLVGRVHVDECIDVSLHLLTVGMAWFYGAFQCELPKAIRSKFESGQETARTARVGIWSQNNPESPWAHRGNKNQAPPRCPD